MHPAIDTGPGQSSLHREDKISEAVEAYLEEPDSEMMPVPLNDPSTSCFSQLHPDEKHALNYHVDVDDPLPTILGQLQSIMAEQAGLRTLLLHQHQQVLQRLSSLNGVGNHASKIVQDASSRVVKDTTNSSNKIEKSGLSRRASGLALTSGKGVYIDIRKLPQEWTTMEDANSEPFGRRKHKREHARWFLRVRSFVQSGPFDLIFTIAILVNLFTVCAQLQWRSYHAAMLMGDRDDDGGWSDAKPYFEKIEHVYTFLFAVEATLRIGFLQCPYLRVPINMLDTVIVLVTCVQMWVLQPFGLLKDASFVAVARLIRLVRMMRFLKVVRFAATCKELRILIRALSESLGCLCWSMIFVISIIAAGGIILLQLVLTYVEDASNPEELRKWSYETFGTISLSMMTLWEVTFSGSWHRYTQRMMVDMNATYAIFWVPYIVCINFAVMRLVSALFLKQTMTVAAAETEKMSMVKLHSQLEFAERIREIFIEADTSGDGKISPSEFEQMLHNQHIGTCFEQLQLDVAEVAVLFELLAAGTGAADYHEFMDGVLKLKQKSRTIDMIQLIHGNERLGAAVQQVYKGVCSVAGANGVTLDNNSHGIPSDHSCKSPDSRSSSKN